MAEVVPFSEAKAHLSELAERVEREHARVLVMRNGRPSFVPVSPDDLDALEETLEILRDRELVASLNQSQQEAAQGRSRPLPSS